MGFIQINRIEILLPSTSGENQVIKMRKYIESILNTNRENIKNAIQCEVAQLSTTKCYRVTEVFLAPAVLFSGQNKYTNIRRV